MAEWWFDVRKPCIGILAGMGPRSTAPFVDMVVDECVLQYGAKNDDDFPAMLIYSLPTPFYPNRPIDHHEMRQAIVSGLRELAGFGVDFIVIPCNMAHVYYDELRASVNVPLLNIIGETVSRIPDGCGRIALLAARATAESGIYQRGIEATGRTAVYRPDWQEAVDGLIGAIKRNGRNEANTEAMARLLSDAKQLADCAVIGCTDLVPAATDCRAGITLLDSARCLARQTVACYLNLKRQAPGFSG